MPTLRPNMYDQQTDMYDIEFLDSLLNQNLEIGKGGGRRKVLEKKRS